MKGQAALDYALANLERLMDGLISVPLAISMFSKPSNVPCPVTLAKAIVQVCVVGVVMTLVAIAPPPFSTCVRNTTQGMMLSCLFAVRSVWL